MGTLLLEPNRYELNALSSSVTRYCSEMFEHSVAVAIIEPTRNVVPTCKPGDQLSDSIAERVRQILHLRVLMYNVLHLERKLGCSFADDACGFDFSEIHERFSMS